MLIKSKILELEKRVADRFESFEIKNSKKFEQISNEQRAVAQKVMANMQQVQEAICEQQKALTGNLEKFVEKKGG